MKSMIDLTDKLRLDVENQTKSVNITNENNYKMDKIIIHL